MPDTKTRPRHNAGTQAVRSPEFKDIYSNSSKVGASPFDFSIIFGRSVEVPDVGNVTEELVSVRFSPQQFKSMIDGLTRTLAAWERAFGEIKKTSSDHNDEKFDELMKTMHDKAFNK
jgi:hypothetical protein